MPCILYPSLLRLIAALWLVVAPTMVSAEILRFPSVAEMLAETLRPESDHSFAAGPWQNGMVALDRVEGTVRQQAWRVNSASLTSLQLLRPLRQQLRDAGFAISFECETAECGGFDFRFALDTLPPPDLQINLGDFRYVSARKGEEVVTLLVSRAALSGYVQVTHIAPPGPDTVAIATTEQGEIAGIDPSDIGASLIANGRAILSDLSFEPGSAQLPVGPHASLQAVADYLFDFPQHQVALVGHTDADGPLEPNITLSRRRAATVVERLVTDYGVERSRIEAQGMGYLAPIASNLDAPGREQNRRVEVIVTGTSSQ